MPFQKGVSGNPNGRIPKKPKVSNKKRKQEELELLLRKLRPNVSKSVITAAEIMQKTEDVKDADRLKACTIILDTYKSVVLELGKEEDEGDDADSEESDSTPKQSKPATIFSLTMPKDE